MYLSIIFGVFFIYGNSIQAAGGPRGCNLGFTPNQSRTKSLYLDTKGIEWRLPKHPDKPFLQNNEVVTLECENGFLQQEFVSTVQAFKCTGGKYNNTYFYDDLLCRSDFHKNVVVRTHYEIISRLFKCSGEQSAIYEVRVRKADKNFRHLYTVCFDKKSMRPKFTFQHPMPSSESTGRRSFNRFESRDDDVWGFDGFGRSSRERLNLSRAYVEKLQEPKMTLFDPRPGEEKYPYYFNRGHLVPYSDFSEYEDQKATVEYINAAPQWKEFNKNQWSRVEQQAREIRKQNPEDWETYTGTYDIIKNRKREPIYLSIVYDHRRRGLFVPIPTLYWKIVHNVKDKTKSRAFVGINNPRIKPTESFPDEYKICQPLANPTTKKTIEGKETEGFTYECRLDDILQKLKTNEKIVL